LSTVSPPMPESNMPMDRFFTGKGYFRPPQMSR
jgi:hypothetical protein